MLLDRRLCNLGTIHLNVRFFFVRIVNSRRIKYDVMLLLQMQALSFGFNFHFVLVLILLTAFIFSYLSFGVMSVMTGLRKPVVQIYKDQHNPLYGGTCEKKSKG